jgi:hypothetical protein
MNDEQIERLKKEQVFKVPEGYFETFTEKMMSQIPQEENVIRVKRNNPRRPLWAAASVAVLIAGASALFFFSNDKKEETARVASVGGSSTESMSSEELQVIAADYMMADNDELYAYMAENF